MKKSTRFISRIERPAEGLHEAERLADRYGHARPVLPGERRVLDEVEIPVLGVMQIGEAAVDQRADEVQRQRRAFVAAEQELRIGRAVDRGEAARG